ncbi:unnamed protein product [Amoebophrya sp. A25]|nr:unnamed protein product [Amoebophrya sp. A25]|eukprot:GSA25T00006858001.1
MIFASYLPQGSAPIVEIGTETRRPLFFWFRCCWIAKNLMMALPGCCSIRRESLLHQQLDWHQERAMERLLRAFVSTCMQQQHVDFRRTEAVAALPGNSLSALEDIHRQRRNLVGQADMSTVLLLVLPLPAAGDVLQRVGWRMLLKILGQKKAKLWRRFSSIRVDG